jgi:hypothetical protein
MTLPSHLYTIAAFAGNTINISIRATVIAKNDMALRCHLAKLIGYTNTKYCTEGPYIYMYMAECMDYCKCWIS